MSVSVQPSIAPRLDRARRWMAEQGAGALVVLKPENRVYLTGFTGSAGAAVLLAETAYLLVDFRYLEQAAAEAPAFTQVRASNLVDDLADLLGRLGVPRVGCEADAVTVAQWRRLEEGAGYEMIPLQGLDRLRWQKDADEVERIRAAAAMADAAFTAILPEIRPGAVENDLAAALEYSMRRSGAEASAFPTIVASGARSALPHGRASRKVIARGDLVTVDFGAVADGYRSDCTRTVVVGGAAEQQRRIYALVRETLEDATARLRPGMTGREADGVARERIAAAGYGEAFGHGLGHGVGLAIHEGPTLSPREDAVLEPGAVVTIEPGVYLPGWGGVRIEDLVVVTEQGCRVLGGLPRDLIEL